MNNLKNCPFCGKRPTFRRHVHEYEAKGSIPAGEYDESYSVSCHECGFEIADEYRDDVIKTWNRRPKAGNKLPKISFDDKIQEIKARGGSDADA